MLMEPWWRFEMEIRTIEELYYQRQVDCPAPACTASSTLLLSPEVIHMLFSVDYGTHNWQPWTRDRIGDGLA
jgi:hypothetical protein